MGTARAVGADDDLPLVRIHGELGQGGVQYGDVVGRRARPRIPGPEERDQGFPRGIERRHERVEAIAALVRGGRPLFIGMSRHQGPVDVDDIELRVQPGRPHPLPGGRAGRGHAGERLRGEGLQGPPHGRGRSHGAEQGRLVAEHGDVAQRGGAVRDRQG